MLRLRNHLTEERDLDRLHRTAKPHEISARKCPANVCLGSTFGNAGPRNEATVEPRSPAEVKVQAKEFLDEYYASLSHRSNPNAHKSRLEQVYNEIDANNGVYELTTEELTFGAKLAWRNAPRCIGRIQWNNIKVFDARKVTTAKEMFDAICRHIIYTTNGGNIRSTITVFPMRKPGVPDFRIWNTFIIGYAGYRNPDGSILGHSINVELTEICLKLGWKSPRTKQDILPLLLSANGSDPELFVIPPEIILEVQLSHPDFDWFDELNIRWFTLPLLSAMLFDCGGLQFPAAPFNGWFTAPEIASRDLGDVNKYNYLKEVAHRMGLNTETSTTLWKDKAMVELNISVLHSFQKAGVTIIDHHTAAEQFMKHLENEKRERGGCPADWVWIVPPISGSTVPVFHQEMALYFLKPSYEYQQLAWKVHQWKNPALNPFAKCIDKSRTAKVTFRQAGIAVSLCTSLFTKRLANRVKATILYATETGKSENFAKRLAKIFRNVFHVEVLRMDQYDTTKLHEDSLIIVITSTFGNGDPPANGESFYEYIGKLKSGNRNPSWSIPENSSKSRPLEKLRYAVFALGSSAYPNVCQFGRNLDYSLELLGGQKLVSVPCGNELSGQEETFQKWTVMVYKAACQKYSLEFNKENTGEASHFELTEIPSSTNTKFRNARSSAVDLEAYKIIHKRDMTKYVLQARENLHEPLKDARTIHVVLKCPSSVAALQYRVGDHIGIVPVNEDKLVEEILARLQNNPVLDAQPVQLTLRSIGSNEWKDHEKLPPATLREMLQKYLDISTPPSKSLLAYLSSIASDDKDKNILINLINDHKAYEDWKEQNWPHLLAVLEQFPSCSPDAAVICNLLPFLQPRFYSVSSSPKVFPGELHLTIGVVQYNTNNGNKNFGVCSNFLNDLKIGSTVACFVRNTNSTTLRMPENPDYPIIMVGPGTGIAPFRGFWQERKLMQDEGQKFGKMMLFFGCRTKQMILYEQEIAELQQNGVISTVFNAYSRESNFPKVYVQDLIKSNSKEIARLILKEKAVIYVCGDVAMAEGVFQMFQQIIQQNEHLEDDKVKDFMRYLKENDRYHMDIFGQTHRKPKI